MKETLKKIMPVPMLEAAKWSLDCLKTLKSWPQAQLHPWRADSIRKLKALNNIHAGKRCFIIGNGPSLQKMDLSLLRNEYTFGMNRFYLMFAELGFKTNYFVSINDLVIEQCKDDFQKLDVPLFVAWRAHKWLQPAQHLHFVYTTYVGKKFAKNVSGRVWEGATVTNVTLQLAYHMGFSEVILIGVDHNFATKGKPNTTIVSDGDDPNHFNPGYFGKGFRWQLPDLDTSEIGYQMAKEAYEADGRKVLDATVDGKLQIFPKVDFTSLFSE
ncbi:MAG: DUF115 domain-containing protein [Anaerolineaceae bacterium]|nr:DUF115 domain-containing protein [Anaerolineaceae bacterium]